MKIPFLYIPIILLAVLASTCKLDETAGRNPPEASFTVQNNGCVAPCNVTFINGSKFADDYSWEFGDGKTSDKDDPTNLYQRGGTYTAILTATSSDPSGTILTDKDSIEITILGENDPEAIFDVDETSCIVPCEVSINNKSRNADDYFWDFGDGNSGPQVTNPFTHTFTDTGTFDICLIATNGTTSDTLCKTVSVKSPATPIASFEIDSINHNGYAPLFVRFKNTSVNADTYTWDFDHDGNTSDLENPSYTYNGSGTYHVSLVAEHSINELKSDPFTLELVVKNPNTFVDQYSNNIASEYALASTADGGYIITGVFLTPAPSEELWILATDSRGTIEINKKYDGGQEDKNSGKDIIRNPNGGYAIAGITKDTENKDDVWVVIADENGDTLTTRKYDAGERRKEEVYGITHRMGGGFAILGFISDTRSNGDIWLLFTDTNGDTLNTVKYNIGGEQKAYDMIQTQNGGYAIVGYSDNGTITEGLLLVVDAQGQIQNPNNQTFSLGNSVNVLYGITQLPNGDFAMVGNTSNGLDTDIWLLVTDVNGNIRSGINKNLTSILDGNDMGDDVAYDIVPTPEGGFAITGGKHNGTKIDLLLLITDDNGNKITEKIYPQATAGTEMVQTHDGGYAIVASSGAPSYDLILVKTDANGNAN